MSDLSVQLGPLWLRNPVITASGTFGYGLEYADLMDVSRLGAIVVKGIAAQPCAGNPPPRVAETASGMLNAIGLQGPGVEGFLADYLPRLRDLDVPVLVNIWGRTVEEYGEIAARLADAPGVAGLELNVSCPNIKAGGLAFGTDPRTLATVVAEARRRARGFMSVKLPPNVPDIAALARVAESEGADALSLINTIPAMAVDVETRRPVLRNNVGGLSGPAIHPVAVKLVWEAARAVRIPIIAMGGIASGRDALEFLIVGATAVAVGTATFTDPGTALRVVDEIEAYLYRQGLERVRDLIGTLQPYGSG